MESFQTLIQSANSTGSDIHFCMIKTAEKMPVGDPDVQGNLNSLSKI